MLTARLGSEYIKASKALKKKDFVFRCRDPHCLSPEMLVVAGERGHCIPHFRHKSNCGCRFAHGETEWHREWKSLFERVEVDMGIDPITKEHNFADAVTRDAEGRDIVIEFQHSPIALKEQEDRERFYKSKGGLIWVHDANKSNSIKLLNRANQSRSFEANPIPEFPKNQWFAIAHPEIAFPKDWVNRPVGVIFDYGPNGLIFLMKGRYKGKAICSNFLQRDAVINLLTTNASLFIHGVEEHLKIIIDKNAEQKRKMQSQKATFIPPRSVHRRRWRL